MNGMRNTTWNRCVVAISFIFTLALTSAAQVSQLEGNWILDTDVPGAEYGLVVFDGNGNVHFTESYPYDTEMSEYVFDVEHTGKATDVDSNELYYTGVGTGVARDTDGTVKVTLDVTGNGVISSDYNQVVGVWVNTEKYTSPQGTFYDYDSYPYFITRENFDPGTPGEELAGVWELTIQGENIDWTGEITLAADGTLYGEYKSSGAIDESLVPMAGLFTYTEDNHFEVAYTTAPIPLPVVGETTFILYGEGQGNEDNTQITGTWTITVAISTRLTKTFEGTFELNYVESSDVMNWEMM